MVVCMKHNEKCALRVIRESAGTHIDMSCLAPVLRDANPENCSTVNEKLGNLGMFLKLESAWTINSPEELRYQFKWLSGMNRLICFHVPKPFAMVEINGKMGYLLERVQGMNVDSAATEDPAEVVAHSDNIFKQLKDIAKVMHANGFTHNDLSPENIIIAPDDRVWIIDPRERRGSMEERVIDDLECIGALRHNLSERLSAEVAKARDKLLGIDDSISRESLQKLLRSEIAREMLARALEAGAGNAPDSAIIHMARLVREEGMDGIYKAGAM